MENGGHPPQPTPLVSPAGVNVPIFVMLLFFSLNINDFLEFNLILCIFLQVMYVVHQYRCSRPNFCGHVRAPAPFFADISIKSTFFQLSISCLRRNDITS